MTAPKRPSQLDSPLLPVIFRYATRAQVWIYRRTGGKVGGKWRIGAGFRKPYPPCCPNTGDVSPASCSWLRCSTCTTART